MTTNLTKMKIGETIIINSSVITRTRTGWEIKPISDRPKADQLNQNHKNKI